jgi:(E)-4-hydroxy-3-methylbut-2-enyl-diphosphate synthase
MRIGTNHGSLSDRILSRYGDTPMGMVESALEFLRICHAENYHEIILSMKSSNPLVMVQAYRLLVNRMDAEGMDYPLHLGVTEAGEGEDGRIKSALGIGTLLEDGLGDTIRVSLTEEPEYEIPVAKTLVDRYKNRSTHDEIPEIDQNPILPFEYNPRKTHTVLNIGGENVPRVINDLNLLDEVTPKTLSELGYTYFEKEDKWGISDVACDFIDIGKKEINFEIPGTLGIIQAYSVWKNFKKDRHYPFLDLDQYMDGTDFHPQLNMLYMTYPQLSEEVISKIKNDSTIVLFSDTYNEHGMAEQRRMFVKLMNAGCTSPVIIGRAYGDLSTEDLQVYASTDMGALMVDGLGDGVYIAAERCGSLSTVNGTAFGVLQASRTRITKTEYISCPSCGRTLFDLQETTARIRSRTEHLKGVKIGIMGCIVNGPGEMADADYGYVGTGVGKITLYKGQEVVSKNMPYEEADEALIQLIKDHGDWVEPKAVDSY